MQDFIFLNDFIGTPELVTLLSNAKHSVSKLEPHITKQMETTNQNVLRDHLLKQKQTSIVFNQSERSLSFVLVILSLFGISSLQLD